MNSKEVADGVFKIANRMWARAYEAQVGDIISVSIDTFFNNSPLWGKCWQIQGWYDMRPTRRFLWWKKFPCLRKIKMVKLMYMGEE